MTLDRVSIAKLTPADVLASGDHLISRQPLARGGFFVTWSNGCYGDVQPNMAYVVIREK
jgi:hypothetical protein